MKRDDDLAAASAAMKAEGHMSYEEFCAAPEQAGRHLHEAGQRL